MTLPDRTLTTGWAVAALTAGALLTLAIAPPFLGVSGGAVLHQAFSFVCHQLPDRTLHLDGEPVALCHRCLGIGSGFVLGVWAAPLVAARRLRGVARGAQARWLVIAALPTAVDWVLGALDLWANTPLSRTLTGALFGLVAGGVLAANLLAPPRRALLSPTLSPDA